MSGFDEEARHTTSGLLWYDDAGIPTGVISVIV